MKKLTSQVNYKKNTIAQSKTEMIRIIEASEEIEVNQQTIYDDNSQSVRINIHYFPEKINRKNEAVGVQLPVMQKIAEAMKELEQLAKEIRDECLIDDDVSGGYTPDPEGIWINKIYAVINKFDTESNFTV